MVVLFGVVLIDEREFNDGRFTGVCGFRTCAGCETVGVCTLFRATSLCGGVFAVDWLTDDCPPRFDGTEVVALGRLSTAP